MKFLTNIDLNRNQLQNAIIHPLASPPASPVAGQIYYNSGDKFIYIYDGADWKKAGVVYSQSGSTGAVIAGLGADGTVTTKNVIELTLDGLTPIAGGYITDGMSLEAALKALDSAVKNAVAGGGEVNQFAFSNIVAGSDAIAADAKTDTLTLAAGTHISISGSGKTATIAANIPEASSSAAGLMSTADKGKLDNIAAGAQVNVQADWNEATSTADAFIKNKPTKLSDFANDGNFIDNTVSNLTNYYTKGEIDTQIGNLATIDVQVVTVLPSTADAKKNIIYLIAKDPAGSGQNIYNEYLFNGTTFELIGDTAVDLSNYIQKGADAAEVVVNFTPAAAAAVPASGEQLDVIIGKITKTLSDLSDVATSGSYDDLTNKPTDGVFFVSDTLTAGATSKEVAFTGAFVSAAMRDATTGETLGGEITVGANKITVAIAKAYANDITITVAYNK